jgi:hypothetical protein
MRTGGKYRDKIHVTITGAAGDPPSCRHDLKADAVVTYRTFKTSPRPSGARTAGGMSRHRSRSLTGAPKRNDPASSLSLQGGVASRASGERVLGKRSVS